MANDTHLASIGGMICANLAGKTADYVKDPTLVGKKRVFGYFSNYGTNAGTPDPTPLKKALAKCGAKIAAEGTAGLAGGQGTANAGAKLEQDTQNGMLAMRQAGVTTVICDCNVLLAAVISSASDNQHYHPEWIINSNAGADISFYTAKTWGAQQRASLMGVGTYPSQMPYPYTTLNQALASVDPGFQVSGPYNYYLPLQAIYWELLQVCSGIQMAGPHLTPSTFETGLQRAKFPNPLTPQLEGEAGFGGSTHTMAKTNDLLFWSDGGVDPYPEGGTGAWCYVGAGRRFDPTAWPSGLQLFTPRCVSTPPIS
jgi:hypothetical protein